MKRIAGVIAIALLLAAGLFAQDKPKAAEEVLKLTTAQSAAAHKPVLLEFQASWCSYCKLFSKMLKDEKLAPIFSKHFVIEHLNIQERKHPELANPGGEELFAKLTGVSISNDEVGVPLIVMLDENGKYLVSSLRPTDKSKSGENIGYPVEPEEIDWFMQMLAKSAPTMSADERKTIESYLKTLAEQVKNAQH